MSEAPTSAVAVNGGLNRSVAAISHDDRAGDVGREVGGKEDRRSDDVLGLSSSAERRVVYEDLHELGVVGARLLVERRLDQAGADGVDPHPVFAELRGKRAGEAEHAVLRGGV